MNKLDISKVRKNFKMDNERINIKKIHNVICQSESLVDLGSKYFISLDEDIQEKYLQGFKKILGGALDVNLFNLEFDKENALKNQENLYLLKSEDLKEDDVLKFAEKIISANSYGINMLLSMATITVIVPTKKQTKAKDEDEDLEGYEYEFIMCMLSPLAPRKSSLVVDVNKAKISLGSSIDSFEVKNPVEGFTYPCYSNGFIDVNTVLYFTGKKNEPNECFIKDTLGCTRNLTAKTQKEVFNKIITSTLGDEVDVKTLSEIYDEVKQEGVQAENGMLNTNDIARILSDKGADVDKVKEIVATEINTSNANLSINNIIPTKKVKISNSKVDITLDAHDISKLVQTNKNGQPCLIIPLDEAVNIDDLKLAIK